MTTTTPSSTSRRSTSPRPRLLGVKTQVPLCDGTYVRYVNLDSAASTPPLLRVQQAVDRFAPWYSSVHRGTGYKSRLSTHLYEHARDVVMRFTGSSPSTHEVVFVRNTTEALNLLAHRIILEPGELVLTTRMEHHSNLLPWYRTPHEFVELTPDGRIDLEDMERRLKARQGMVRLVTVSGASNVTGIIPDIRRIARLAHQHGALIAVDAAQLAPERIDILAFSGHKLYAPYGAGALIVPTSLFANGQPMLVGGGSACLVTRSDIVWTSGADLEEAGSPNVIGVVAMSAALEELMRYGMDKIAEHERYLTRYAIKHLQTVPGISLYGPSWDTMLSGSEDRLGVFSFKLDSHSYSEIAAILANEWGIGVRSGCFCAHQYVAFLMGVSDALSVEIYDHLISGLPVDLPGMVRASMGLANTREDIDRLVAGLTAIAQGNIRAKYTQTASGDLEPVGTAHPFIAHGESLL
jgi:cysteine desulfurase / selenocysteine lyase